MNNSINNRFSSSVTNLTENDGFIIGEYDHLLEPNPKEKGKYICPNPNCNGHNLSISKNGLEYDCYNCHDTKAIAKALRELAGENLTERVFSKVKPQLPLPSIPDNVQIGTLTEDKSYSASKKVDIGKDTHQVTTTYYYNDGIQVKREERYCNGERIVYKKGDKERDKHIWIEHAEGKTWLPYRYQDIVSGKAIILVEGEKSANLLASKFKLVTVSLRTLNAKMVLPLKDKGVPLIIYLPDNDDTGKTNANMLTSTCREVQIPLAVIPYTQLTDKDFPEKGDIEQLIDLEGDNMNVADFISRLEAKIHEAAKQKYYDTELIPDTVTESSSTVTKSSKGKKLTQKDCANIIISAKEGKWVYDVSQSAWRECNEKYWQKTHDKQIEKEIIEISEAREIPHDTASFIKGVKEILAMKLSKSVWTTLSYLNYINLNNGVLDLATNTLGEHKPEDYFTSVLPYDYNPISNLSSDSLVNLKEYCPEIHKFSDHAMGGDAKKIVKLLAIINGIIRHKFSRLQKFVSCIGAPATGKGTFMRLLEQIVGEENCCEARAGKLGQDYTVASIIDKQLVLCSDEDKLNGEYAGLRVLTGGGKVTYRQIYKEVASSHFYGTIFIASNNAIFGGETTGLARRICQIEFKNPVSSGQRDPNLSDKLAAEIPYLIPIVLAMPDSLVTNYIKGIEEGEIAELDATSWYNLCDTNSVADWLDNWIVIDANCSEFVGTKEKDSGYLYHHYLTYCENTGKKAFSSQQFSTQVVSVLTGQNYTVSKYRKTKGMKLIGLRLKGQYEETPTLGQLITNKNNFPDEPNGSTLPTYPNEGKALGSTYRSTSGLHDVDSEAKNDPQNVSHTVSSESIAEEKENLVEKDFSRSTQCRPDVDLNVNLKPIQCKDNVDHVDLKSKLLQNNSLPITEEKEYDTSSIGTTEPESKDELEDYFQFGDKVTFELESGLIITGKIEDADYDTGRAYVKGDNGYFYPQVWIDELKHRK